MKHIKTSSVVAVAIAACLAAAGCGSSKPASSPASNSSTTAATASGSAATTSGSAATTSGGSAATTNSGSSPATGTPVEIASIADGTSPGIGPEVTAGLTAGVGAVNAAGGIHGHPIKFQVCNDQGDPNQAATCARNAASNPKVLAMVGSIDNYGPQTLPILESNNLANIGPSPGQADYTSFGTTFNTNSGFLVVLGSIASAAQDLHAKRISLIYINVPAVAALPPLVNADVLGPLGEQLHSTVPLAPTATDVSAAVKKAAEGGTDMICLALTANLTVEVVRAARQLGITVPIMLLGSTYSPSDVQKQLSGATSNLYAIGSFNHQNPGWTQYLKDAKTYNPSYADPEADGASIAYSAVKLFAYAANKSPSLTRQGILQTLRGTTSYSTDGLTPTLNFTQKATVLNGAFAAAANLTVSLLGKYENGQYVPIPGAAPFTNIFPSK